MDMGDNDQGYSRNGDVFSEGNLDKYLSNRGSTVVVVVEDTEGSGNAYVASWR